MKKIIISIFTVLFLVVYGCSNNSGGNPTNPFNGNGGGGNVGGGNGGGNVTFQVQVVQDQQQQNYFEFTPSTSITLNSIVVNCAAAGVNNEQVQGDGTTVFSNTNPINVGPITVQLQSGQQWTFTITGKVGSSTGADYTANASYNVP